ncbi:MAG: amidoligase family protein [Bacteroidales bacterium]|nr:amidoligase family protein [Bacteroidales bacterium]
MQDKTTRFQMGMKAQTFGVEVEMNSITREHAAKIAAEFFGTNNYRYTGEGYSTWSAWDAQGRKWKFASDSSISGPENERCELVTPILTYADMETLQALLRLLRKAGAKSSPSRGCGVHIHVGLKGLDGRDHNPKTLRNLANIMAAHEEQIGRAIRIDRHRTCSYCRVINPRFLERLNKEKPDTMAKLADVWYEGNGASYGRDRHYNDSRYHMLNLHACFTKGTIEFRLFQFADEHDGKKGGLHAGELKTYIQLCLAMSELAKEVKYASPKPQQTENEKYAMRCWLLRMGFIGDEFKTAREIILRNIEGNAAWRFAS